MTATYLPPTFSVIIPTYNRRGPLEHTLRALSQQTLTDFEVVVAVDGSTDDTEAMLAGLVAELPCNLRYVVQSNAGPAAARNSAAALATGRYLLFIDDDIEAVPQLLAEHAACHAAHPNAVVIGTTPAPPAQKHQPKLSAWASYDAAMLDKHYRKIREGIWPPGPRLFYTGNSSLSRTVFEQVGGFTVGLQRGEDIELGYRLADAGQNFVLNEAAVGWHLTEERTWANWQKIPYRYGRLDVALDLHHNRYGLVATIGAEFHERNLLIRLLTRLCLDRLLLMGLMCWLLGIAARLTLGKVARAACSAAYNLRYYQGMVDKLGAVEVFWANTDPQLQHGYDQLARDPDPARLTPGISVILATRNRPASLAVALEKLLQLDYPNFELIIADQSDAPLDLEVKQKFEGDSRVRYFKLDSRGRSRAFNSVYPFARFDIIGSFDDDCRPSDAWLYELGRIFGARPEVSLVSGAVVAGPHDQEAGFIPVFELSQNRFCGYKRLRMPGGSGMGANLFARRRVYEKIGPQDEVLGVGSTIPGSDDFDLCYRAYRAGFIHLQSPHPWLWHDGYRSNRDLTRLVNGYNSSLTAAYTKYVRCGDWVAARLLLATLLFSLNYSLKRVLKMQRPLGLRGFFASLRGVWQGLRSPLDRTHINFTDPASPSTPIVAPDVPLSVAICTRNRPQDLEVAARSVLATGYPKMELLIVDQSEADNGQTEAIVAQLAREIASSIEVRYLKCPPQGISFARNLAMHNAAYEIVAFTDDDCRVKPNWLARIAETFREQPHLSLLIGEVVAAEYDRKAGTIPAFDTSTGFRAGKVGFSTYFWPNRSGMSANFALRRTAYQRIGPFDPALGSGGLLKSNHDFDYFYRTWRHGFSSYHAPDCQVLHDGFRPQAALAGFIERNGLGCAASLSKNLRCGDWRAGLILLNWLVIALVGTARFALPRLIRRQRPLGLRYLKGFLEGTFAPLTVPIDTKLQIYRVADDFQQAWADDKSQVSKT